MFIRYPVAYAVNLTTRWMEFHHQGNKSYSQVEVALMWWLGTATYTQFPGLVANESHHHTLIVLADNKANNLARIDV